MADRLGLRTSGTSGQIHTFFCDVRDLLSSRIGDGRGRPTTRVDRFEGSFTRYPVLSEIAVTYRCNLACTFCYAGCGTPDATPGNAQAEKYRNRWKFWRKPTWWRRCHCRRDPVQNEMTAAEVLRVIDQIAIAGKVPSVSFTGGECTLRPELPDFIAHARKRSMRVNIITNGVLCSSRTYVDQLVAAGLTSAQVSLEGPDAARHDALTQRSGSFAKTVRGIRNLRDAGLHVHTNTTICEENAEHLPRIIDLAKSLESAACFHEPDHSHGNTQFGSPPTTQDLLHADWRIRDAGQAVRRSGRHAVPLVFTNAILHFQSRCSRSGQQGMRRL